MSIWKYRYFVDVVDLKSFTKAGKKNFITQTAVSQQIADLEKKIGGKLIDRESGVLVVTELGQIVYDRAKEIIAIDDQMRREIDRYNEKYVIKVGIDSSINKLLWFKMQEMIDRYYSEEDFKFNRLDGLAGGRMLHKYEIDIFIGYGIEENYLEKNINEFEIDRRPIGIYVGKNSAIDTSLDVTLNSLRGYVRYGTLSYPCSVIHGQEGEFPAACQKISYVDNVETMKLKVEFNNGYAFVDSHYFSQCSDGAILLLSDWKRMAGIKVYYRKNRNKEKMKDVLSKIKKIMKE